MSLFNCEEITEAIDRMKRGNYISLLNFEEKYEAID